MSLVAIRHGVARIVASPDAIAPGDFVIPIAHVSHVRTEERDPPTQLWIGVGGHTEHRARQDDALDMARKIAALTQGD